MFAGPYFLGPNLGIREPMGDAWLTGAEEFVDGERANCSALGSQTE
jgi:hypothetical protein